MGDVLRHRAAGRLAEPDPVAAIARGWRRSMEVPVPNMAVVATLELVVGGEAATGQHDAAARTDLLSRALALHDRARDRTLVLHQFDHRAVQPEFDAALLGREGESGDQAVAVGEACAALVVQPVDRVACRHARDMERRADGTGHLEDVRQVVAAEHHAAERHHRRQRRP